MKEKIKCPKCGSSEIKKLEGFNDFLHLKKEGEPARKQIVGSKPKYRCLKLGCEHEWEEY